MKRKKKKKVNNQHSKQEQRANFNHFSRLLHQFLRVIECEELAKLFDKESCNILYQIKNSALPRLRIAPGVDIRSKTKKNLFADFDFIISEKIIEVNNNIVVSAKEVMQFLSLIDANVQHKGNESFDIDTTRLVQKYKDKKPKIEELNDVAMQQIVFSALYLGLVMCKMNTNIYWFKLFHRPEGDEDKKMVFELNEYIPKKHTMIIDGHPRPVYPLCLAFDNEGPKEISIPAWRIRLPKDSEKAIDATDIPVYFQNHLLHRLEERLDCIPLHMRQYWLYSSMENPKFVYFKGKRLVEYIVDGKTKLGYIVLEFHMDRLLAKTFLLLTNSGTPEGEKLKEISGMEKCDLKYWSIDKMSTFQTSDLNEHPKTKVMFEQAGCGDLFKELSISERHNSMSPLTQAKQMLRYLKRAKEQEEMLMAV